MCRNNLVLVILGVTFTLVSASGSFAAFLDSGIPLPGLSYSRVAWGDFNNDGRLDLVVCGYDGTSEITRIYRNDGQDTFTDIQAGLPGVQQGAVAWGDYDGDGYIDLALTGKTSTSCIAAIYRNNGDGTFSDIGADLPGVYTSAVAWGDYDNDGDLDLVVCGAVSGTAQTTYLCRNDRGSFVTITDGLPAVKNGAVAFGDWDNDGDLDLAITGMSGASRLSHMYYNENAAFSSANRYVLLPSVDWGGVAWANYGNSGRVALAISGSTGSGRAITVYRPTEYGYAKTELVPGSNNSQLAWGDMDGDGDFDLAVCGYIGYKKAVLFSVNNSGSLSAPAEGSIPGVDCGSLAWADYDNDGDLDIVVCGNSGTTTRMCGVYRNDQQIPNTIPTAPTGLTATISGDEITFGWSPSSDNETATAALSYNIRVGSSPGAEDIVSGMADPQTGFRRIPALGNAQARLSYRIKNLQPANNTYYWSVQAIDASFAGSAWAPEAMVGSSGADPSPQITSVTIAPALAAGDDILQVAVQATDNLAFVTAAGVSLTRYEGNIWRGQLPASCVLGIHTVPIVAEDSSGNRAEASCSYKTVPIVGAACKALAHAVTKAVRNDYLFKLWGKASIIDGSSFMLNDGSDSGVMITAPGYSGITNNSFVIVRGMLTVEGDSITVSAVSENIAVLH